MYNSAKSGHAFIFAIIVIIGLMFNVTGSMLPLLINTALLYNVLHGDRLAINYIQVCDGVYKYICLVTVLIKFCQ